MWELGQGTLTLDIGKMKPSEVSDFLMPCGSVNGQSASLPQWNLSAKHTTRKCLPMYSTLQGICTLMQLFLCHNAILRTEPLDSTGLNFNIDNICVAMKTGLNSQPYFFPFESIISIS